ncbi:MAG: hypothetical protein A2538_04595 [Candidatus Magasanikbacteria bacterium RIFOXYD2_FULL_41_14]|uniref:RNA polymerase sigma factor 70 region 4 type 2 domain-containing protein n=1 Tax=Candidatus Magasanikbacteria bacterium RIFOXYD2_FULL_41_14 TaxID=1798709 RepID=A0A1F6PFV5_9BACT|nr:MAG: hypothetical protein A2538_04595 [Candidatus Magasanikbacteria bacterium RIFOXYD2_FULL_41_14]
MIGNWNEKILIFQLQTKRDPDAFASLYDIYVTRIYRFVYFKVGSHEDTEDLVSEIFLKTWNYVASHKDEELKSFSGLLYRVARNSIVDFYRAKKDVGSLEDDVALDVADTGKWYEDLTDKLDAQKILLAIKKLKQEYQEVITLRFVDELDIAEISEITGKGQVAVRVTLHRALKKLKEIVESNQ